MKLALIGAISKIIIFLILFTAVEQMIDTLAFRYTDKNLSKMKEKTMSIVKRIGIKSYLDAEKDSTFASYNILKDEYISIYLDATGEINQLTFSDQPRIIESEKFDYRILNYSFEIDHQRYMLEIGKNIQLIYNLEDRKSVV